MILLKNSIQTPESIPAYDLLGKIPKIATNIGASNTQIPVADLAKGNLVEAYFFYKKAT